MGLLTRTVGAIRAVGAMPENRTLSRLDDHRRPPPVVARSRAVSESGAAAVEFALVLPLLLTLLFGIVDFSYVMYRNQSIRFSTQQSARFVSVGSFGGDSTCPLSPAPASTAVARVMCQTKSLSGLADGASTRVALVLTGSYAKGNRALLCTEYSQSAISGVTTAITGKVARTKAVFRIERASDTDTLTSASETPLSGSWSWCA